jgi:hypothetical protein
MSVKFFKLISKANLRKLGMIAFMLLIIFLLSGGTSAVKCYMFGAESSLEYKSATVFPLVFGFTMMGAFGLLYGLRMRGSKKCLFGFVVTLFCFVGLELMFYAVGGG